MTMEIDNGELRARTNRDGKEITIILAGTADTRALPDLDTFLKAVHGSALEDSTREVTVDFRELDFMNSSCFKAFVTWLGAIQDLEAAKQYRVRFLSDDGKHWQRRSLAALSCFAVDLVQIET